MLNVQIHGTPTDAPPLVIVHGLFGSGRNWSVIAKRLSDERQVLAPDLRNHGSSFHEAAHDYPSLAGDLADLIDAHGGRADLVGHSMGGKAAMTLALKAPDRVRRLLVADIAPVSYGHSQMQYVEAMRGVDLDRVETRADAAAQLARTIPDPSLRSFFTQSLDLKARRWRLNLDALAANMTHILGFPDLEGSFEGPTLFLSGAQSDYVRPEHRDQIRPLFPKARFARIPDAGHWLHADQPRAFEASVRAFLQHPDP